MKKLSIQLAFMALSLITIGYCFYNNSYGEPDIYLVWCEENGKDPADKANEIYFWDVFSETDAFEDFLMSNNIKINQDDTYNHQ